MKESEQVRTVEMVRRIRDQQAAELEGKSTEEVLAYFHAAGVQARAEAQRRAEGRGSSAR